MSDTNATPETATDVTAEGQQVDVEETATETETETETETAVETTETETDLKGEAKQEVEKVKEKEEEKPLQRQQNTKQDDFDYRWDAAQTAYSEKLQALRDIESEKAKLADDDIWTVGQQRKQEKALRELNESQNAIGQLNRESQARDAESARTYWSDGGAFAQTYPNVKPAEGQKELQTLYDKYSAQGLAHDAALQKATGAWEVKMEIANAKLKQESKPTPKPITPTTQVRQTGKPKQSPGDEETDDTLPTTTRVSHHALSAIGWK
jgi:hypothetical protein